VTYHPEELAGAARAAVDITLKVSGSVPVSADGHDAASTAFYCEVGAQPRPITVAARRTPHRRH
jgi:hypothetical protein